MELNNILSMSELFSRHLEIKKYLVARHGRWIIQRQEAGIFEIVSVSITDRDCDEVVFIKSGEAVFEYWTSQDVLIPPWITNWFQLRDLMLLEIHPKTLDNLISQAISKAGNVINLSRQLALSHPSLYNLVNNKIKMISVMKLRRILAYLDLPYASLNGKIQKLRKGVKPSIECPKFPINLATPAGAALLGMAVSDGCIYLDRKARDAIRTKYAAGEAQSADVFTAKINDIYGRVHIYAEEIRNCVMLNIKTSIVGETLLKVGAVLGNKTSADLGVPWLVMRGPTELKTSYLRAAFSDEGSVYLGNRPCKHYITLSRYRHVNDFSSKQAEHLVAILKNAPCRTFPTGHVNRTITLRRISMLIQDNSLISKLSAPPQLLQDESKLLNELEIDHRIFGRSISLTHCGRYSLCFDLFINKRASLIKFYKYIGFSLRHKQLKLNKIMGAKDDSENI
jgi:hypothetical protein